MFKARYLIIPLALILFAVIFLHAPKKNNTVTFMTLQLADFSGYFDKVIKDFESENPGVTVKIIDVPFAEGEKRTLASLFSDNPPDLINLNPAFSFVAAKKNTLFEIPSEKLEQFPKAVIRSLAFNGKNYSVPFYMTSAVTFANKELMKKNGINTVPKTYDELFKIKPNNYLFMPTITENDYLAGIISKYGINVYDKQECISELTELFEKYKKALDGNIIPKEALTQGHRDALEKYLAGQTVFFNGGVNFLKTLKENSPDVFEKTEIYPQITERKDFYNFSVMTLIIPKRAKNKEIALKFALFLTNEKNQLEFSKLTGVLPANKFALENDYFNKEKTKEEYALKISAEQIKNTAFKPGIPNGARDLTELLNFAAGEYMTGKNFASPSEFCTKIKNFE